MLEVVSLCTRPLRLKFPAKDAKEGVLLCGLGGILSALCGKKRLGRLHHS